MKATRDRIKAAPKEVDDQPSLQERSLRNRRTQTVGIMVPELGNGYHTQVMSGISDQLMEAGYFYFTLQHTHRKELVERYTQLLLIRGSEALITVDTALDHPLPVPGAPVAGPRPIRGGSNIAVDHRLP